MSADASGQHVAWSDLRQAFVADGSLRDIVVAETTLADWERAYEYVGHLANVGLARVESDPDPLPQTIPAIFALSHERPVRLAVFLGLVQLNCFFFVEDEIEFDLSPKEVASEAEARRVMTFMQGLAEAVGRPVHLTGESARDWKWLTFAPVAMAWTFEPESGGRSSR